MDQITLKIGGMTCAGCVRSVQNVLQAQPGVESAEVSLEEGRARVRFDPACASVDQLREAVEGAGYDAEAA